MARLCHADFGVERLESPTVMTNFILVRDVLLGIGIVVGLPLLVRKDRGMLIFTCFFVGLVIVPRVLFSAWRLFVEVIEEEHIEHVLASIRESKEKPRP